MGAKASKNAATALHLEGKAVSLGDPPFPNLSWVLHFLDIEGRVALVAEE
jgi:hypothetical protein